MSKYKHLLFDVDGTIVDSFDADIKSLIELLNRHRPSHGKTAEDLAFVFGIPSFSSLKALGFDEEQIPKLTKEWIELEHENAHMNSLFDGIIDVIAYLKDRGFELGIVTSRSREGNLGGPLGGFIPEPVHHLITRAICAGDTPRPKPYPDPILHYMEITGAKREEILFIGDALTDLQAADAAGVDFALALWGYHGKDHPYCRHYLKTPWDLVAVCTEKDKDTSFVAQMHAWAREINAIGQIGLTYCDDRFDRERYERLQNIAAQMAAHYIDESAEIIKKEWCTHGYKTPQVDTRAAIFDDQGRILMVKEKLSQKWDLPGGWCDENLSVVDNILKEVREEANMDVHAVKLVGVFDRNRHNTPDTIVGCLKFFVECSSGPGTFTDNTETLERRFFAQNELPVKDLRTTTCTLDQIMMCFACHKDKNWKPILE